MRQITKDIILTIDGSPLGFRLTKPDAFSGVEILRLLLRLQEQLSVLHVSDMLSETLAVSKLVENRLNLYAGDWWENPAWGNEILRMLQEGRLTEADAQSLSTYLAGYVRETTGVREVQDEKWSLEGLRFFWSCTVLTEYGPVSINSEF